MIPILEVYHAGVEEIKKPDVFHSRPQLDFGPGFYLTDIYEQAVNWSIRRANKFKREPIINKYLLRREDLRELSGGRSCIFKAYNDEWLDFVVGNRLGQDLWKSYDYIEGGVADDRVVDTIDLYMTGFIPRSEGIERLKYLKPNNQICISRQSLLDEFLSFTDSIIVENHEQK